MTNPNFVNVVITEQWTYDLVNILESKMTVSPTVYWNKLG